MRRIIRRLLATVVGISAVVAMVGATLDNPTITVPAAVLFAVSAVALMGIPEDL